MSSRANKAVGIKTEVLNDLASRFLINISEEDRKDVFKLCSQVELAHWFYLDLVRPEDHSLPACSFKEFMATIFHHCPFLVDHSMSKNLDSLITQWKAHKYKKPVRGGIILNKDLTKCLLVRGYPASTSWGFPKGKLEEGEDDVDTAVREVYEETGFDTRGIIKRTLYLEATINDSHSRMYIIPGVSESTLFEPKTRKEIRDIQWFSVYDLPVHRKDVTSKLAIKNPNNFFLVIPFISKLRKWVAGQPKKKRSISASFNSSPNTNCKSTVETTPTAPPRPSHSSPLLPTPHTNVPPIPYPSPHPHTPPQAHHSLPAPLRQSQTGQFYQGSPQYTTVYPPHIAYANHNRPPQQVVLLPTPHGTVTPHRAVILHGLVTPHGTVTPHRAVTPHQAATPHRQVAREQLHGGHNVNVGDVLLRPSMNMTQFQFQRERIITEQ